MDNRNSQGRPFVKIFDSPLEGAEGLASSIQKEMGSYEINPDGSFSWYEDLHHEVIGFTGAVPAPDASVHPGEPLPAIAVYEGNGKLHYLEQYISTMVAVVRIRAGIEYLFKEQILNQNLKESGLDPKAIKFFEGLCVDTVGNAYCYLKECPNECRTCLAGIGVDYDSFLQEVIERIPEQIRRELDQPGPGFHTGVGIDAIAE